MDYQVSYFIDVLSIFELQLEDVDQVCFIVSLMHGNLYEEHMILELAGIKEFQFQCPKFLTKSEKAKLANFMSKLAELVLPEDQLNEEFFIILASVKTFYS